MIQVIITFSISAWMGAGTSGFRVGLSVMTSMFPYRDSLLFCQGLHKFFGSISGVVFMNTTCILIDLCAINAKTLKHCVDTNYLLLECLEC